MKFLIKKTTDDQFYFLMVAGNGEVVMTSESYTTKQSCKKTIKSIKRGVGFWTLVYDLSQ